MKNGPSEIFTNGSILALLYTKLRFKGLQATKLQGVRALSLPTLTRKWVRNSNINYFMLFCYLIIRLIERNIIFCIERTVLCCIPVTFEIVFNIFPLRSIANCLQNFLYFRYLLFYRHPLSLLQLSCY